MACGIFDGDVIEDTRKAQDARSIDSSPLTTAFVRDLIPERKSLFGKMVHQKTAIT